MLESAIQRSIIQHLKKNNIEAIKLIKTNVTWIADIIILFPDFPPLFLEVKQEKWKESAIQVYRRETYQAKWFIWYVAYSYTDYLEFITKYI